ncbi:hypothetical protein ROA7450_00241 [Roseovarius albus]|uniref:Uncharacterized protein n=1 Tax=Roseovarius albus TaxID=1247867 RepID=A0A1X6Y9A5_9RHOB|nr:hypothetical protein [Roseovarius albus]SLN14026.1 hypothetical protein ROA7450_00241 [Roseovarius albus]
MPERYEMLTKAFESLSIEPTEFGHVDHVGVAFLLLRKYDILKATCVYCETINTIATRVGAARIFNVTTTLAFLSIIAERLQSDDYVDAEAFIARNQDLIMQNPLKSHYSMKWLQSGQARTRFLLPDLAA